MPGGPERTWDFLFGDELRRVVELSRMVVAVQHYRMRSDGTPHYTMVTRVGPFLMRGTSDYVVYDRPHRTVNRVLDSPFGGTFHINETYTQLEGSYDQAARGITPELLPCEIYCHSLTDPSILGPELREAGAHTLTLFALHQPARLFRADPDGARRLALKRTLAALVLPAVRPLLAWLLQRDLDAWAEGARHQDGTIGSSGRPGG